MRKFAAGLSSMASSFEKSGIPLCFVLLPYEKISKAAARVYSNIVYKWESAFEDGVIEKIIRNERSPDILVSDPLIAFKQKPVEQCFVYNLEDKFDWNHPNRAGHNVIADHLAKTYDSKLHTL